MCHRGTDAFDHQVIASTAGPEQSPAGDGVGPSAPRDDIYSAGANVGRLPRRSLASAIATVISMNVTDA